MPWYRVIMCGQNYLVNFTGEPEILGFHVTHYVKSPDEEMAQRIATIRTRQDRHLHESLLNTPDNPSRLSCASVRKVWWRRGRDDGRYHFWEMGPAADEGASGSYG